MVAVKNHCPPPLHMLIQHYREDPVSKDWRFGQWFMNRYMTKQTDAPLWNERNVANAFDQIACYYEAYQWDL